MSSSDKPPEADLRAMAAPSRRRLLIQYLEPSAAVDAATAGALAAHLAGALDRLPVTDLALGWKLRPEVVEAVREVVPGEVTVWRWVPVFTDSGSGREADTYVAVGPDGAAPPPFRALADFRFLCLDHDEVVDGGFERVLDLAREIRADGVMLDRIRWHSPSASPVAELTCFCDRSRDVAARDGLDLGQAAAALSTLGGSLEGRRTLVASLLGRGAGGVIGEFVEWRRSRVTAAVARVSAELGRAGLRSALDVFTPALAPSVGQDLAALAGFGEWSKSMTYFEALGPASMPFEMRGYAAWLSAAGDTDAPRFLADLLGFDPPDLVSTDASLEGLRVEMARLSESVGRDRGVVGIDAVEIPGVCDVADDVLAARIAAIGSAGLGMSPSWELLAISENRMKRIAGAWHGVAGQG